MDRRRPRPRRRIVKVVKPKGKKYLVLRWTDPETDRPRQRSAGVTRRRDAERIASVLESQIIAGTADDGQMLWDNFRVRYEEEQLASLSKAYQSQWKTAANWLESMVVFSCLAELNTSLLSRFAAAMRKKEMPETTIATYLRPIRAALKWASDIGLIDRAPKVVMPKRAKGVTKNMRSRPVNLEEFERILMVTEKVRPKDHKRWERLLWGAYRSGFRIGELLQLSWNPGAAWSIDLSFSRPLIRLLAEGEKSHRDRFQAITPEFWEICSQSPAEYRQGFVFPIAGCNGQQMTSKRVIRVISQIGKKSGVITDAASNKFATSSDIGRRAFATQLGKVLSQSELAEWMRHASPQTTMQYYHAAKAIDLAEKVWAGRALGDTLGDTCQNVNLGN